MEPLRFQTKPLITTMIIKFRRQDHISLNKHRIMGSDSVNPDACLGSIQYNHVLDIQITHGAIWQK